MKNKQHPGEWEAGKEGEALSNGCGEGRGVDPGDCYDTGLSFDRSPECTGIGFLESGLRDYSYGIAEPSTGKMIGGGTMKGRCMSTGEGVG